MVIPIKPEILVNILTKSLIFFDDESIKHTSSYEEKMMLLTKYASDGNPDYTLPQEILDLITEEKGSPTELLSHPEINAGAFNNVMAHPTYVRLAKIVYDFWDLPMKGGGYDNYFSIEILDDDEAVFTWIPDLRKPSEKEIIRADNFPIEGIVQKELNREYLESEGFSLGYYFGNSKIYFITEVHDGKISILNEGGVEEKVNEKFKEYPNGVQLRETLRKGLADFEKELSPTNYSFVQQGFGEDYFMRIEFNEQGAHFSARLRNAGSLEYTVKLISELVK